MAINLDSSKGNNQQIVGFHAHDHNTCKAAAMAQAAEKCRIAGVQLTVQRRRVLEILLEAHAAMGAYDVLERLRVEGLGDKPPIVYRALSFLVEHGLVHRIEKLNAFVACAHPGAAHDPAFLICRNCRSVAEGEVGTAVAGGAGATGFITEHLVVEAEGLCPSCQEGIE